ncbi:MAG: DUF2809 domain-containing protein [Ferruginibacter sp.]
MSSLLKFNRSYFALAVLIFVFEILIAKFAHDKIIRPYIGDLLVVILIYCFVKAFITTSVMLTAISVLLFSYAVEISQYFHVVNMLGLQHSKIAAIIMGTSFEWIDLVAYTIGIAFVLFAEKIISSKNRKTQIETT